MRTCIAATRKAQQLHYNNCDVVILMHKKNNKRRCWHSYGTPGAGDDFLKMHSEVSELWEEYIYNYEARRSQATTEATIIPSIPPTTTVPSIPPIQTTTVPSIQPIQATTVPSIPSITSIQATTVPSIPPIQATTVPSIPPIQATTLPSIPSIQTTTMPSIQGELDAELGVRDDREKYYLLWREVGVVEQLTEYGSSNTSTESVVIELDSLLNEAWILLSKSEEKKDQLQVLESRLHITNDETRQQCIVEGKCLAIKQKLEWLQADMEMSYLSTKKKQVAIQSFATSSKQRSHLRRAITSEKKKLTKCVQKYNDLCIWQLLKDRFLQIRVHICIKYHRNINQAR